MWAAPGPPPSGRQEERHGWGHCWGLPAPPLLRVPLPPPLPSPSSSCTRTVGAGGFSEDKASTVPELLPPVPPPAPASGLRAGAQGRTGCPSTNTFKRLGRGTSSFTTYSASQAEAGKLGAAPPSPASSSPAASTCRPLRFTPQQRKEQEAPCQPAFLVSWQARGANTFLIPSARNFDDSTGGTAKKGKPNPLALQGPSSRTQHPFKDTTRPG